MVNNILKVVLFLLACFLAFKLYKSITNEIEYRKEVDRIEAQVIDKLERIRMAELAYKDVHGDFTDSFDSLINFINNGKMKVTVEFGDKDDTTSIFRSEERLVSVKDSMFRDYDVSSLRLVPPMDTAEFELLASRVVQGNVEVPVFMARDPWPFDKQRSNPNHPKPALQVGSISEASYAGNWK